MHPKSIGIAFLGIDTKRGAGFSGSLRERTGEFAEEDSDHADGIVAFIADEVRDGPRPKRTPETAPRLEAVSGWISADHPATSPIEANSRKLREVVLSRGRV